MKYVCLIYQPAERGTTPKEDDEITTQYASFIGGIARNGVMTAFARLGDVSLATTVRLRDGKRILSDGPFAEAKEVLAGLFILECSDLDEALDYAGKIPTATFGSIEVRPLVEF